MTTELSQPAGRSVQPPPESAAPVQWGALALLLVGSFVTVLDYFIANVAIPSIQSDLAATPAQIELVIAGYGVAFTAGMIACGRLGDIFGRRRLFAIGLVVFTAASLSCGFAANADVLVASRVVQGVGAAILVPQVLGIIAMLYTGEHRTRAFMAYGVVLGVAGVFGQFIGGVLIDLDIAGSDWRAVFLINVPIGLVGLALVPRLLPRTQRVPSARLDVVGAVLVTAFLVLVVGSLVEGRQHGWPDWALIGLVVGVLIGALGVAHLRNQGRAGREPLLDLGLFRARTFAAGLPALFVHFLAMGSFFFLLALFVQSGHGLSALESGILFMATGGGYFATSAMAPALAEKMGSKLVVAGPIVVAAGYGILLLTVSEVGVHGAITWMIPGLLVAGAGMGMTTGPLTDIVLSEVDVEHAASASGAANTAQEGGSAIGVAIVGTVFYPVLGNASPASDYARAFEFGLLPLIGFALVAAVIAGRIRIAR